MFKVNGINEVTGYLAEEGQPNPLRWAILSKTGEKEFKVMTPWIKCKDFFNDYVYTYQTGKSFTIYGFTAGDLAVPAKGEPAYMLLKDFNPYFVHNMGVLNEWLESNGNPSVEMKKHQEYQIIKLDPFFPKNTYNMSLITLIIRLMNDEHKFASFQEAIECKKFASKDQLKWNEVCAKKAFFKIPEKLSKYIWYYNADANSEKVNTNDYQLPYYVHNCGVLTWQKAF